jgi:lysocardiolipin and lysophospholipid acyltransferase
MPANELRQRSGVASEQNTAADGTASDGQNGALQHPAGKIKHGIAKQLLRMVLFGVYFLGTCVW